MSDPETSNANDPALSDERLAELERAAERGDTSLTASDVAEEVDCYQRYYSLVDSLASPIRMALTESEAPPCLPEYGDLEEIGRGGMGIVYRGLHQQTRRVDAVKVIRPDRLAVSAANDALDLTRRLRQEAQLAARLAHEHIVPVYQVGEIDGCPWFSMQLVEGENLRDLARDARLLLEEAVMIMEQIARAVDEVHRHGILHGDIKPHNILIERDSGRPLITDFGLADIIETPAVASGIAGTPAYMAPELAEAALQQRSPDEVAGIRSIASDVYSLGATLLSVLTGKPPCDENFSPKKQLETVAHGQLRLDEESRGEIPDTLMEICNKCMSRDPDARFATAGQLADALSMWLNRPRWNRYFPGLRHLLLMVVAPVLGLSGLLVWWLLHMGASEGWIWAAILSGYPPLFLSFSLSQKNSRSADRARRELWSVWTGHLAGTLACLVSLRLLCHPDFSRAVTLFYPVWAALACVVFFAKSGNFWIAYRWIGVFWAIAAIVMAATPDISPVLFGAAAALTCVVVARGDDAFQDV